MIFPAPCELPEFETIMDALEKSIAIAKASNDAACSCKGIRFKTCASGGQPANSFPDHREGRLKPQMYETRDEWREVNGTPEPKIPERRRQP
mgnify:CR=1 FL=1